MIIMKRTALTRRIAATVWGLLFVCLSSSATFGTIVVDYSNDASTDNFFATNTTAKAALEAAVNDINSVIISSFGAITPGQQTIIGSNGGTSASITHSFSYTNPSTGVSTVYNGGVPTLAANEIRIFVGMRELSGSTLGQGGPGGHSWSISGGSSANWPGAFTNMINASNAVYLRGNEGPVISEQFQSATLGPATGSGTVRFGNTIGNLWFDNDTNNDTVTDNAATLDANWHFDHTTSVAAGKADFYSVALHEVLHAVGFGTSLTWNQQVSGTNWTGSNVISLLGTGTNVIDSSGSHIASGLMSARLSDGVMQQSVMSPSILLGTRKTLTALDRAFLQDLNFNVAAVPEPGSMILIATAGAIVTVYRRRKLSLK
jgi:hypothetical protein